MNRILLALALSTMVAAPAFAKSHRPSKPAVTGDAKDTKTPETKPAEGSTAAAPADKPAEKPAKKGGSKKKSEKPAAEKPAEAK